MPPKKPYRRLQGSSAYYPFGLRATLRRRQRRQAFVLRALGVLALLAAGWLALRQTVFRGGQPLAPDPVPTAAPVRAATRESAHVAVTVRAATADVLAQTADADSAAHASPEPQPSPAPEKAQETLPQYRALYEQNPDMVGWLRVDGTNIDYPVLQTPGDNEYYLRRGFDRLYSTAGSLFLDERCRLGADPTATGWSTATTWRTAACWASFPGTRMKRSGASNPTFTFDTLTESGTWQVAAVLRTELGADEWPYYTFFEAEGRAEWQRRVDAILALSLYDTASTPNTASSC